MREICIVHPDRITEKIIEELKSSFSKRNIDMLIKQVKEIKHLEVLVVYGCHASVFIEGMETIFNTNFNLDITSWEGDFTSKILIEDNIQISISGSMYRPCKFKVIFDLI